MSDTAVCSDSIEDSARASGQDRSEFTFDLKAPAPDFTTFEPDVPALDDDLTPFSLSDVDAILDGPVEWYLDPIFSNLAVIAAYKSEKYPSEFGDLLTKPQLCDLVQVTTEIIRVLWPAAKRNTAGQPSDSQGPGPYLSPEKPTKPRGGSVPHLNWLTDPNEIPEGFKCDSSPRATVPAPLTVLDVQQQGHFKRKGDPEHSEEIVRKRQACRLCYVKAANCRLDCGHQFCTGCINDCKRN